MENEEKLGQNDAFARPIGEFVTKNRSEFSNEQKGMSKRFYVACAAMNAMIFRDSTDEDYIAERSFEYADALLKEENK